MLAPGARSRGPVRAAVVEPQLKGQQNRLCRQRVKDCVPPVWVQAVIVEAAAAFAAKAPLQSLADRGWGSVFGRARTWQLADGPHLRAVARQTPHACSPRSVAPKPDGRRQGDGVFRRTACGRQLGQGTLLLSNRRQTAGPPRINLIGTNLTEATTGTILSPYPRRWGGEVAFKELKSGLHLGQLQVTTEPRRGERGVLLPVLAYLLLLRLYGREVSAEYGTALWQLKRRFTEEVYQEHYDRSERRWRKKLAQYRAAA